MEIGWTTDKLQLSARSPTSGAVGLTRIAVDADSDGFEGHTEPSERYIIGSFVGDSDRFVFTRLSHTQQASQDED